MHMALHQTLVLPREDLKVVQSKNTSAYIAFKDGKNITIQEALK
jgi:hypothetical protein